MKKVNFDELKNFKTPDSWIENAINIPKKNKKTVPWFKKPYIIASAACFVICCTIGVIVYCSFGNSSVVPVAPPATVNTAVNSTVDLSQNITVAVEATSQDDDTQTSTNAQSNVNSITQSHSSNAQSNNANNNLLQKNSKPVVATEPAETVPPATKKPDYSESEEEYIGSAHPYLPTENPTIPCETQSTKPTGAPAYSEDYPSEDEYKYFNGTISFVIKEDGLFRTSKKIYCHISSPLYGEDSREYSIEELCTKEGNAYVYKNIMSFFRYDYNQAEYTITFYDEKGNNTSKQIRFTNKNKIIYES